MNYKRHFEKGAASLLSAFLLLCFLSFQCSKDSTNGNQTITISGTVTLEGRTDHSGVTQKTRLKIKEPRLKT